MFNQVNSFSQFTPSLFLIVLTVTIMHLSLLLIGSFWHMSSSPMAMKKPHSKVAVQTVQLNPFQSNPLPSSQSFPPTISDLQPISDLPTEAPKTAAISVSQTIKEEEQPIIPKPALQQPPKTSIKQTDRTQKPIEPIKKANQNQFLKSKEIQETEKKRQEAKLAAESKKQQEIAAAQKIAQQKEQALIAKAQENLAKMKKTRDKISALSSSINLEKTPLPQELGSLQVDTLLLEEAENIGKWETQEISYSEEVAYRLKAALRLPDYGAVKIKLTIDLKGKVVKIETIQSESKKNKDYVESKIPTLIFPAFGQRFQGLSENTFVISLQNGL